jgi:hypothetical protein
MHAVRAPGVASGENSAGLCLLSILQATDIFTNSGMCSPPVIPARPHAAASAQSPFWLTAAMLLPRSGTLSLYVSFSVAAA